MTFSKNKDGKNYVTYLFIFHIMCVQKLKGNCTVHFSYNAVFKVASLKVHVYVNSLCKESS